MQTALALEKSVNQALLDLHKVAASHGDEQVGNGMMEIYHICYTGLDIVDILICCL